MENNTGKIMRLLKNGIYVFVILAIIVTGVRIYDQGDFQDEVFVDSLVNELVLGEVSGRTPEEKIAYIATTMHSRYPEIVSIAGIYRSHFVQYEINLKFDRAEEFETLNENKSNENEILGVLSLATAKAMSAETTLPNVERNYLESMAIYASKINVVRRVEAESQSGLSPGQFIQESIYADRESEKIAYLFDRKGIIGLVSEPNPENWHKYQAPVPFTPSLPNTGPIEKLKPTP
jgi:small basic protein